MNDLNSTQQTQSNQAIPKSAPWPLIALIIAVVIGIGVAWQYTGHKEEPVKAVEPVIVVEPVIEEVEEIIEPVIEEPVAEVVVIEPEPVVEEILLPSLDESDEWLKIKLPEMTWRQELLSLLIDEDMIRRLVVFTDNFAQGTIAYEHSLLIAPKEKFSPDQATLNIQNNQETWQWNESATKRFSLYVDLIRSVDSEKLVQWYFEVKPLIDEAYGELGYGDEDFTATLQDAITRVLDMELPNASDMTLTRPSVMYHFSNEELESLPETDKLLLRLGKDNLLVMKSVLLEFHEKLAQQANGVN
jgi:hypothetical protein